MKAVEKKLCQYIQKMEGSVLCIGVLEDSLLKALDKNESLSNCYFLNVPENGKGTILPQFGKKTVSIKKLRKRFKKKKTDYMICHTKDILMYQNRFWKDSIYLTRKKIYFYGETKEQIDSFIQKYKRYNGVAEYEYFGSYYLVSIDVHHSFTHVFSDIWYTIIDALIWFYEMLGDLFIH